MPIKKGYSKKTISSNPKGFIKKGYKTKKGKKANPKKFFDIDSEDRED